MPVEGGHMSSLAMQQQELHVDVQDNTMVKLLTASLTAALDLCSPTAAPPQPAKVCVYAMSACVFTHQLIACTAPHTCMPLITRMR